MDKKFYISLEAAKLLKEKGYNEETDCTIDYNGDIWFGKYKNECDFPYWFEEYKDECDFPCITKSEAIDWLEGKGWKFSIISKTCDGENLYEYIVYFENKHIYGYRKTMLEAQDAAIISVLENL